MRALTTGLGIAFFLLAGCAGNSGTYAPDCVAFEGDTIELADGKFMLDKFTDQVEVDESGNVRDPFPGYPMRGTYRFDGHVLHLQSDSGTTLPDLYLVKRDGHKNLLTSKQFDVWKTDQTMDDCVLTLSAGDDA